MANWLQSGALVTMPSRDGTQTQTGADGAQREVPCATEWDEPCWQPVAASNVWPGQHVERPSLAPENRRLVVEEPEGAGAKGRRKERLELVSSAGRYRGVGRGRGRGRGGGARGAEYERAIEGPKAQPPRRRKRQREAGRKTQDPVGGEVAGGDTSRRRSRGGEGGGRG